MFFGLVFLSFLWVSIFAAVTSSVSHLLLSFLQCFEAAVYDVGYNTVPTYSCMTSKLFVFVKEKARVVK